MPAAQTAETPAEKQLKFKQRTLEFARNVVLVCRELNRSYDSRHLATQLIRCSTSVAANYRAACRSRSKREFIATIGIVLEEADEALFWLEFAADINLLEKARARSLQSEASQFVAILTATLKTAKRNLTTHGP